MPYYSQPEIQLLPAPARAPALVPIIPQMVMQPGGSGYRLQQVPVQAVAMTPNVVLARRLPAMVFPAAWSVPTARAGYLSGYYTVRG